MAAADADELRPLLEIPIGTQVSGIRIESDSMGQIEVPAERYYGAQTARSLVHFAIGDDVMPAPVARALGVVKKAAAIVNARGGRLPRRKAAAISRAADEVIAGQHDAEFPLHVWQTGSGTQSNMNVNEVIANRASQLLGGELGKRFPVHPNDDVNQGQSSNDAFPTAMHIATAREINDRLLPAVAQLHGALEAKAVQWRDIVKIGRTHLQDAVPLTVGQEWSGYAGAVADARARIVAALPGVHQLALGGTAVGTGLNCPPGFAEQAAAEIAELTGLPFLTAPNKFVALGTLDAMVAVSGSLRGLAATLLKIAEDIRWLGSGPRCGLHELILPENEPGSSIMPGKVNPTQSEAMIMVALQVMGADVTVGMAGAMGNFELNTMRPVIIANVLHSIRILADMCRNFTVFCVDGIELDEARIADYVARSPMLVTALSPVIGYDRAAAIAHKALAEDLSLREAALATGWITAEDYDQIVDPSRMVGPAG